jgi:hypothetical protein
MMKNQPKCCETFPHLLGRHQTALQTKNVHAFFGDPFIDKNDGLRTHNPAAEEVGGLGVFFVLSES